MGGSNWSSAHVYTTVQGREYFVKTSGGAKAEGMFQGEALGLVAMYGGWTHGGGGGGGWRWR